MFKLRLLLLIVSYLVLSDGQKGYRLIRQKVSWKDAFRICQDESGRLATIEEEDENLAAIEVLETETNTWSTSPCFDKVNNGFEFWIAGQRLKPDQPKFCDRPFYWKLPNNLEKPVIYANWAPKEPDCTGGADGCIEVLYSAGFQWNDVACSELMCPLCQIV